MNTTNKKEAELQIRQPKILLLRYSNFKGYDTIKEHQTVIEEFGYCWFGKFGKKISSTYMSSLMKDNCPCTVFLYTPGALHKCKMIEVTYERPSACYPEYYDSFLFKTEDFTPQVYMKFVSMESIELNILEEFVVVSSGKPILYDLKKTISSFIIIQNKTDWIPPIKKEHVVKVKPVKEAKSINANSCVYRKNEVCTNRGCVNYSYECDRPKSCAKQKVE